jgi:hypothetical protein
VIDMDRNRRALNMKRLAGSLLVAAMLMPASMLAFPATPSAALECTAVPSQEHARIITVLPENAGTLTAADTSGGIIQCE